MELPSPETGAWGGAGTQRREQLSSGAVGFFIGEQDCHSDLARANGGKAWRGQACIRAGTGKAAPAAGLGGLCPEALVAC